MIREITHDLAIADQVSTDDLQALAKAGYRSVLNLRSPTEKGFLTTEQHTAVGLGLCYDNIPTDSDDIDPAQFLAVMAQIKALPKPLLLHCDNGVRAAALALTHIATQQGMKLDQALQKAGDLGRLPIVNQSIISNDVDTTTSVG
jgi:uncharacterized protein (TIGR01244 family)